MRRAALLGLPILLSACMQAPGAVAPREATAVNVSAAKAWDAVIDQFAARNIPVRTMERVSGFISTDALSVGREGLAWADCGRAMGVPLPPDRATYNVLVRGGDTASTVKVTVRWTQGGHGNDRTLVECSTKGVWEAEFEGDVKARAEGA
jgi:hypothetical protein